MCQDDLRDETLPGKQEQHGEWATVLSQPRGLGHVLLGPLFLHLSNKGPLKTFPFQRSCLYLE